MPVQGVPFTAEIGGEGLLSWGVDPAQERHRLAWEGPVSWRLFVTSRLARALLHARHESGPGLEPWRFALERLRLEGVDISTWTPMDPQRQTGDARGTSRAAAGSLDADSAIAAAKARDQ